MQTIKTKLIIPFVLGLSTLLSLHAEEVLFHVDPKDNFQSVMDSLSSYVDVDMENQAYGKKEILLTVAISENGMTVSPVQRAAKMYRDYYAEVNPKEKKKIKKIVTTLGFDSLISIANPSTQSDLKKVGKDIDHIHPLKFLEVVFADDELKEELKAGIAAIRDRAIGWIWDEFLGGLVGSLKEETAKKNMKPEFIQDFARKIPIDINLIRPSLNEGRFKDFVNILIDNVPRENNPNRYGM